MCGHGKDGEHGHECSPGEDYERNLAEQQRHPLTRRQVLRALGTAGLLVAGGAVYGGRVGAASTPAQGASTWLPSTPGGAVGSTGTYVPQGNDDFDGFSFLSGDHHIHTQYSPDGKYTAQHQVAEANYHGLTWLVITDHGGEVHNKIGVDLTYPEIVRARDAFKNMLVFTGLEMNIPGAEHATVMVQPTAAEKDQIKAFEAAYDGGIVSNTEAKALEGMRYLQSLDPRPLFFANHPARRGLDSPREIRAWKEAAPDVAFGFEGAPGHQAASLLRDVNGKFVAYRGFYGNKAGNGAHAAYPPESYFTYGGFDWMTAKLGGVWDSLLGDGLRWWITANSDAHKYYNDLQIVDTTAFKTAGYVTPADRYLFRPSYGDFRPGEYSRTYVVVAEVSYAAVMEGLRAGRSFVVQGDLIDRLKFTATAARKKGGDGATVTLGGTLQVAPGDDVMVEIAARVPSAPNFANQRPVVDHIDLIAGDITRLSQTAGFDNQTNPTTRVVATFDHRGDWTAEEKRDHEGPEGMTLRMNYTFRKVERDFYIRLRGTNTDDRGATPAMDPDLRGQTGPGESPWDDLWFYSNPIFVTVTP